MILSFNPRPRARGDALSSSTLTYQRCFNPRPRARGDFERMGFPSLYRVSIHAPARGATAPQKHKRSRGKSFNPRPRARGDLDKVLRARFVQVSIHAPARGATAYSWFSSMPTLFPLAIQIQGDLPRLIILSDMGAQTVDSANQ